MQLPAMPAAAAGSRKTCEAKPCQFADGGKGRLLKGPWGVYMPSPEADVLKQRNVQDRACCYACFVSQ